MITALGSCYQVFIILTFPVFPAPALWETSLPPDPQGPQGHSWWVPQNTCFGGPQPLFPPHSGPAASQEWGISSKPHFTPQAPITDTHRQFQLMSIKLMCLRGPVAPHP